MKTFKNKSYYSLFEFDVDGTISFKMNLCKSLFSMGFYISLFDMDISFPMQSELLFSYPSYEDDVSYYGRGVRLASKTSFSFDNEKNGFNLTWCGILAGYHMYKSSANIRVAILGGLAYAFINVVLYFILEKAVRTIISGITSTFGGWLGIIISIILSSIYSYVINRFFSYHTRANISPELVS